VGGQLTTVSFHEGDYVKTGDRCLPRSEAARSGAESGDRQLARDEARSARRQATWARDTARTSTPRRNAARYAELFQSGVVSRISPKVCALSADASGQAFSRGQSGHRQRPGRHRGQ